MTRTSRFVVAVICVLGPATPAAADVGESSPAPIVVGHFDNTTIFPNDVNTCGFPLFEVVRSKGSFRFFEGDGGPFANIFQTSIDFSFTANGKTVVLDQRYVQRFSASEPEFVVNGLSVSIRLLGGGLIVRDAGTFVQQFDGTVSLVRGPHPILEAGGVSAAVAEICALLAA